MNQPPPDGTATTRTVRVGEVRPFAVVWNPVADRWATVVLSPTPCPGCHRCLDSEPCVVLTMSPLGEHPLAAAAEWSYRPGSVLVVAVPNG